jgi:hypothetical protein
MGDDRLLVNHLKIIEKMNTVFQVQRRVNVVDFVLLADLANSHQPPSRPL